MSPALWTCVATAATLVVRVIFYEIDGRRCRRRVDRKLGAYAVLDALNTVLDAHGENAPLEGAALVDAQAKLNHVCTQPLDDVMVRFPNFQHGVQAAATAYRTYLDAVPVTGHTTRPTLRDLYDHIRDTTVPRAA